MSFESRRASIHSECMNVVVCACISLCVCEIEIR